MNLLFTDAIGNQELKEHLGFLDVDIKFKNLKGKLITATYEIIDLIGNTTYQLCYSEYIKEDSDTSKNADFIFNVRNSIAIQGYRKYAPHNDLAHTTQGRIARLEDKQKSPFQWQIDNDNEALERSYYESLDSLIKYLDLNIASWKETDQYKKTQNLFIKNSSEFDDIFTIGKSRLIFLKLAPGLKRCEDKEIVSRVGKELFNTLKADASINEELSEKIKEATVFYSLAWGLRRYSAQIFPEGVVQNYTSDRLSKKASKVPENDEAYSAAVYFKLDADEILLEIENLITEINRTPNETIEPITFNPDINDKFISL